MKSSKKSKAATKKAAATSASPVKQDRIEIPEPVVQVTKPVSTEDSRV